MKKKKSAALQKAERDLAKTVKAFNQSVSRAIAAGKVSADVAPAKESVRAIKQAAKEMSDAERRAYYREQIRILKKIRLKTAFDVVQSPAGAAATKFEIRRAKSATRKQNISMQKRLEALESKPVMVEGKAIKGTQRVFDRASLQPIKFDFQGKSSKDWEQFKRAYRRYEKPQGRIYLENLKEAARANLNSKYAARIVRELDRLGASKVLRAYEEGYRFADIEKYYSPTDSKTDEFGLKMLASCYLYDIDNYWFRWYAEMKAYPAKMANGQERKEDFMRDVQRFGKTGLARALDFLEQWALVDYHERKTRAKLFETWDGITKYI